MTRHQQFHILNGMAHGDALGAPYETPDGSVSQVVDYHKILPYGETPRLDIRDGQWTDDSTMALAGAFQLAQNGRYDAERTRVAYLSAYRANHLDEWTVGGMDVFTALLKSLPSLGWGRTIPRTLIDKTPDPESISGGAIMRAPYLAYAVYGALMNNGRKTDEELFSDVVDADCKLTHSNPTVIEDVRTYVNVLMGLMHHRARRSEELPRHIPMRLCSASAVAAHKDLYDFLHIDNLVTTRSEDFVTLCRKKGLALGTSRALLLSAMGCFVRATRLYFTSVGMDTSLMSFATASHFNEAINIGGDVDTRCAILGALFGVFGRLGEPKQAGFIDMLDRDLSQMTALVAKELV